MSFRLVPKSVTLNDFERRNGRHFALFQRIRVPSGRTALISRNQEVGSMGVGAGLYMCDVVVKSSRSLSHLLISSCQCLVWVR